MQGGGHGGGNVHAWYVSTKQKHCSCSTHLGKRPEPFASAAESFSSSIQPCSTNSENTLVHGHEGLCGQ